jgi:micrococcal nuclease
MVMRFLAALVSLFAALASPCVQARTVDGVVSHVTDGDTIWVRPADGGAPLHVRLQGIDAPELCQTFGPQARAALTARLLHQRVQLSLRARDAYDRSVARVSLRGQDVGAWLVAEGYAWTSGYARRSGPYAEQQAQARLDRRGLWASHALEPRLFRRRHGRCPGA